MASVRNTRKFRTAAADLRERCALHEVTLVAGEIEDILAAWISDVAHNLGVTERTVLDSYLTEHVFDQLVAAISRANAVHREASAAAEPVTVDAALIARVFAAVGMTMKLSVQAMENDALRTDALGVATDSADAVVGVAAADAAAGSVEIGGPPLVYVRRVLTHTVAALRDGTWACPCPGRHVPGRPCQLQSQLIGDLALVGGWIVGEDEPPTDRR